MVSIILIFVSIAALLSISVAYALGFVQGAHAAAGHCSSSSNNNNDNNNDNNDPARCSNQPHHHSNETPFILPFP